MNDFILHITSREAWLQAQSHGHYSAESLTSQGFIHCSTSAQVLHVAEEFYKEQSGLVLLVIDPKRLASKLKWEAPSGGTPPAGVSSDQAFPHIYGPINLEAVIQVVDFHPGSDGKFFLPDLP